MIRPLTITHNMGRYHLHRTPGSIVSYWDSGAPGTDPCFEYIVAGRVWGFKSFKSTAFGGRYGPLQALLDAGCYQ